MADDLRERAPLDDAPHDPAADGTRSDTGASSTGTTPVAPGGAAVDRAEDVGEPVDERAGPRDPLADVKHPTADR